MSHFLDQGRTRRSSAPNILHALRVLFGLCIALAWGYSGFAHAQTAAVRVALVQAVSDALFFIAEKEGYFAQEGIRVAAIVKLPACATARKALICFNVTLMT